MALFLRGRPPLRSPRRPHRHVVPARSRLARPGQSLSPFPPHIRAVARYVRSLLLLALFHSSCDVAQINSSSRRHLPGAGRVTGLTTTDSVFRPFDAVVSNSDAVRTHRELIGGAAGRAFDHKRSYEPAGSGIVLYLGLNKRYDHLAHHDFVFSRDPHEEFHHIYSLGEPAPDPTCYLAATVQSDPTSAPAGGEALYVLVHTPYLRPHHDWQAMLPAYRQVILNKLKRTAGLHDIEDRIVFERHLTPRDIHDRYRVLNGAIYGISSHGAFNGAFKPANRSRELPGLYLAGGAAHPGPGMPMVLMSGWIAADSLDHDFARAAAIPA